MGIIGWIAASAYLILSLQALYALKGATWVLVSLAGPIAFFPLWAAALFNFNDPVIWSLFLICVVDALRSKQKNETIKTKSSVKNNNEEQKNEIKTKLSEPKIVEKSYIEQQSDLYQEERNQTKKIKNDVLIKTSFKLQKLVKNIEDLEEQVKIKKIELSKLEEEANKREELLRKIKELEEEL